MRFTHFQVTFQQTNAHLFVTSRVKFPWNSAFKLAIVLSRTFEVNFSTIKSYKAGMKHASWSEQSGCTVTIPTWRRARLLFQHGVGLARALSFGPTNYEQCLHLSEWTCAYWSPRNKHVPTLCVSTSLKNRRSMNARFYCCYYLEHSKTNHFAVKGVLKRFWTGSLLITCRLVSCTAQNMVISKFVKTRLSVAWIKYLIISKLVGLRWRVQKENTDFGVKLCGKIKTSIVRVISRDWLANVLAKF